MATKKIGTVIKEARTAAGLTHSCGGMRKEERMKQNGRKGMMPGVLLILAFAVWTVLITQVDVQPVGQLGTDVGFAGINTWFHGLTGVHLWLYELTDKLELLAIAVCVGFGALGLTQMIQRKSLMRVDRDILLLGAYYMVVILAFLLFEKLKINYRPVLIEGKLEASYPSSTTLLVLSVMPTLIFQVNRRMKKENVKMIAGVAAVVFTVFVAVGRLVCGVHWLTDIIGAVLLSAGLYLVYRSAVMMADEKKAA